MENGQTESKDEWLDPWHYDAEEGITKNIQTLEGFYKWIERRYEAGYKRKERLNTFVVLGQWVTDSNGNVGNIVRMEPQIPVSAPVILLDDLQRVVKLRVEWNGLGPSIPKLEQKCVMCGDGWTLRTLHLNHMDSQHAYHPHCWKLHQLKGSFDYFTDIFKAAGFQVAVLTQTPNQYTNDDWGRPWFHVDTMIGQFLIGRRKRVINIDWSSMKRDLSSLFEDVNDTKGPDHIHAYTTEQAAEYLRRIRVAMEPATAKEFEIWSEADIDGRHPGRPGANRFFGKCRGVDFQDACNTFFKTEGNDPHHDFYAYENTFNGWKLLPVKSVTGS